MILSFAVISILNLMYSSIGNEINLPFLVKKKNYWNRLFLESIEAYLKKDERQGLSYSYFVFFTIWVLALLLYKLVSLHPCAKDMGYPWGMEAIFYTLLLLFGFKSNSELKESTLRIVNQVLKLAKMVVIIFNVIAVLVIVFYLPNNELPPILIMKINMSLIVAIVTLSVTMYIIYILFPHLSSKLLVGTMKFIFCRLLKHDRQDPISGLFRHCGYITGIFSLVQFIISWLLPKC
jgi:hypothetical protein